MEAAIRFSQNSFPNQADQLFLKVDVAGRVLQVYSIKSKSKSRLQYDQVYESNKLQPFRAFDWHPIEASLVAIGQTGGEANLVNLSNQDQTSVAFNVRSQRSCNAVGLNTQHCIAIGLDKVRTDFCLNIWDVNQRTSSSGKNYGKASNEPLHKLAGGEPITSLRFFQDQPQLIAAGVKGQFIRLYDLRESTPSSALQFSTRCVNNIAVDSRDENYFASCLPTNTPTVAIWDRRMVSRTSIAHVGFGSYVSQADQHPEVSVELRNVVDPQGQIWGLRFSKTQRGHLGVLSSTGQLRMLNLCADMASQVGPQNDPQTSSFEWDKQNPQDIFLDDAHDFAHAFFEHPQVEDVKRIVSFDFTTAQSKNSQPKIITLTGDGNVEIRKATGSRRPFAISSSSSFFDGKRDRMESAAETKAVDKEPGTPQPNGTAVDSVVHHLKPKDGTTSNLTMLVDMQKRCESGYLLEASKNMNIVRDDEMLEAFWAWVKHAHQIASGNSLMQSDVDLSYLGVFGLWTEHIDVKLRATKSLSATGTAGTPSIVKELTQRLHLVRGRGCATQYPDNRALCIHVAGVPWSYDSIQRECDKFITDKEHTKAAAVALFAGEEKIAQRALRSKGTGHSHRMLAMALVGARNRQRRMRADSHGSSNSQEPDNEGDQSQDEEWEDIISAIAEDLTDRYARSILAYVKTGEWEDVVKQACLPLRYKVSIALRHFDDSKLQSYLSSLKHEVSSSGNLEGILVTGLGTTESVELFKNFARITNDIQTAALGLSFAAASDRFLPQESPYTRTVFCFREIYKARLMSCGLKYDKARFDVEVSRAQREYNVKTQPRKKEQIRLVCSHCDQPLSQFGHEQQMHELNAHVTDTARHPLAPEKAAVAGVVCPKCGRHLPRCGVCDLWLGTPDETFSKWYKAPSRGSRNSNSADLSASLVGSTVTAIGPRSNAPSVSITGVRSAASTAPKLTTADLAPEAVEIVVEGVAKQEKEKKWYDAMHKFTFFCMSCSHGFHAEHAKMWFGGTDDNEGHRTCPVPLYSFG
ncbi:hypothetical protein LTR70_002519 [Exophiala xenobiotica]|uniref:WD repeat protein mio zinc-ribbon like domain-containing protein n=1 Tax=Lithohypha guttulata TaxID=1690604 RepID=A0ABR0KJY2_9EURO|nr:hypothetical protein LTR24_001736 [Lithohypha guttulata]KAK5325354.1 hypothetical protein LTR70_002519 [Exophiala xenobiotica]